MHALLHGGSLIIFLLDIIFQVLALTVITGKNRVESVHFEPACVYCMTLANNYIHHGRSNNVDNIMYTHGSDEATACSGCPDYF